jgi:hypothetical protein
MHGRVGWYAGALAFGVAMAEGTAKADCTAGQQITCGCLTGTPGVQVCAADGTHFDPCVCGAPPPSLMLRPERAERRSRGLFIGGVVLLIVGSVSTVASVPLLIASAQNSEGQVNGAFVAGGSVLLIGGLLMVGAGIPMMIIGGHRLTPDEQRQAHWWMPTNVNVGPNNVRLGWTF